MAIKVVKIDKDGVVKGKRIKANQIVSNGSKFFKVVKTDDGYIAKEIKLTFAKLKQSLKIDNADLPKAIEDLKDEEVIIGKEYKAESDSYNMIFTVEVVNKNIGLIIKRLSINIR